jgi:hypothetical protein
VVGAPGSQFAPANQAFLFELCTGDANGDGRVDVQDLTAVIVAWCSCPTPPCTPPCSTDADLNCDGFVSVQDLTLVILNWGLCFNACGAQLLTLCQEFEAAGLTQSDCTAFRNNLGDARYRCWTVHYLNDCSPTCTQPPSCLLSDPYRTGRH